MIIKITHFSVYLHAELSIHCPVAESARIQTAAIWQHMTKQTRNSKRNNENKEKWIGLGF